MTGECQKDEPIFHAHECKKWNDHRKEGVFRENALPGLKDRQPFVLSFFQDEELLGKLVKDSDGPMTFEGQADESAKIFFDWVKVFFETEAESLKKQLADRQETIEGMVEIIIDQYARAEDAEERLAKLEGADERYRASQITIADQRELVEGLEAQAMVMLEDKANLVAALVAVEWTREQIGEDAAIILMCPSCGNLESEGHHTDCLIGIALGRKVDKILSAGRSWPYPCCEGCLFKGPDDCDDLYEPGETGDECFNREEDDGVNCICGHLRSQHNREQGCMVNTNTQEIDDEIGDHTCRCVRVYLEDGKPDGFVGDHDGEEEENLGN